jgi:O-antigen/teichoic acid export membrane protein
MQKNFIAIAIAFNILFFVFAPLISYILFWEKYNISWEILRYSILFLVFNFLLQINFNILAWIWKVKERLKIILIALIFNFILNIILINTIWVYWAALATWIGWILIWVLSEMKLWRKYLSQFDYKFLTKNIIFMWLLWYFSYHFINPLIQWFWRLNSFWIMFLIWITWFSLFWLINFKDFKNFILEIKRMKKL